MKEFLEREAVLSHLEERRKFLFAENGDYDHYSNGFDEAVDRVESFPAADVVEVRHGKWLSDTGSRLTGRCSQCREIYSWDSLAGSNYCPACGCRMDGGNE